MIRVLKNVIIIAAINFLSVTMINEPIVSLCGEPAGFCSIYRNNESDPYIGEGVGSTIDLK